ncbi:related to Sec27p, YMR131c and human retinoblastoma-binding protein [Cephalotrichum gorgonifer]|uniref:Related to Sec27p, YMR131c and human retinoblastoma-binding protein n=1 Tax=Cephalotrichum gorgonifer TaxID=2041049 RepID=A0AAE8SSS9_9PEZI|nr:related to Sec27p, YMR131c and human retinoblastoma-binding protein [Cephalotrichum gorgonifer]
MLHSALDRVDDTPPEKGKPIKSAYDSSTFDSDITYHVDGRVGSASISPCGRDVALASPDGLAIIDLDSPLSPPRRLRSHGLPWLVVDVQWSPFSARDYWVVSTANHRALVWNLNLRDDSPSGAIEHSLQGHNRAITDVNFSAHHPDILSTCSVDGYVHCWDLRRPRQPVVTFCDWFSGATQVKHNRQDPNILASSHDRWLHIWDERKPSKPLRSINGHHSKIYGIDWNRIRPTAVVTCSLDKSIKYWDYAREEDIPERVIRTDFPVWRARHTPFGNGLLAIPQTDPGDLYLYHNSLKSGSPLDGHVEPAAVFPGHGNHKVKEFLWRSRGGITEDYRDERDFQLVSWGADNELRLQYLDASVSKSIDYVKGGPAQEGLNLTRQGAVYKTFRTVGDGNHERRDATMSDPRPSISGSKHYQSALTLGMREMPARSRLGAPWKGTSMTAKSANAKDPKGSLAQIGWMKGVTMTKRKPSGGDSKDVQRRNSSKDPAMFGHGYMSDDWAEPETVQEEVLQITRQLPKVKWESVEMDTLTLEASLNGPWGVENASIFFKVKVDIPTTYPKSKAPIFSIEKTALMPSATHKRVESEIHKLAQRFLERKQNCLNVAFTYLLGEVDLEASTSFFKNVKDFDDDLDGLADESSSEDEDNDEAGGGSTSMSQELTSSVVADNSLAPTNRMPIPPPPRLCGARFSHDGRLVCFFPTKEEKANALFTSPEGMKERAKGEPFFPSFGRIIPESPLRQRYARDDTSATDDKSDSEEESVSSTSSSDSESTSMLHKSSFWYQPGRSLGKAWSGSRSVRSSGGGTGVGTGTGTGASKKRPSKPRNVISIHDIRDDLPSKKEFAEEYLIFGDGAEVCSHNAGVAEKYGRPELVDIWNYAALLLRKGIPLEFVSPDRGDKSVLVIARDVMARLHGADDFDDVSETGSNSSYGFETGDSGLAGRAKWGTHPLATEFVRDLFAHFEQLADIQMLAMLSCIFGESTAEDSVAYIDSHITQPETPLPLKAPSFSLDYFPAQVTSLLVSQHHGRSYPNSAITTPRTVHTPVRYSGSQLSDDGLWTGDPESNSYSCGETPPMRTGREYLPEVDPSQSLSSSPNARPYRRMNSGLASSLAANFPRTFGTQSVSSSPPNLSKKRPSPGETMLGNLAPTAIGAWGSTTVLGDSAGTARTSLSDDEFREEFLPLVPISVSVDIEDQTIFDDDGWLVLPLLDTNYGSRYAGYRYAYAEMLQMWKQPLARLEVMKFNVLKGGHAGAAGGSSDPDFHHMDASSHASHTASAIEIPTSHVTPSSPILLGKKEHLQALLASGRGLDVTGICRTHETQLDHVEYASSTEPRVGGAVGTCDRCRRTQKQLRCVYCLEPVDALYPPCLSCGCASHEACLAEWHAAGEVTCPAGDECNCVEEASNGQVETWAAMVGALERLKKRRGSMLGSIGAMLPGVSSESTPTTAIDNGSEGEEGKGVWENVGSAAGIPSRPHGTTASPVKLSYVGYRLKQAGEWGRATGRGSGSGSPSGSKQGRGKGRRGG